MKRAGFLIATLFLSTTHIHSASAQVSVDQRALEGLETRPTQPRRSEQSQPRPSRDRPRTSRDDQPATPRRGQASTTRPAAPAPAPLPPLLPPAPPPVIALPPPIVVPSARPAPVVPAPVVESAAGEAAKLVGGVRVTFGTGSSDLNPTTQAALRSLGRTLKANEQATVNLLAYSVGVAEDPSTPRRLALSRAMAVRAVLISEGVASTRIYVRALGATATDGPPDRVDVVQVGLAPQAAQAAPTPATTPAPTTPTPTTPASPPAAGPSR